MDHRDAEITEVTIVLSKAYEDKLAAALELLKAVGLEVIEANDDLSIVEGTIESWKLHALEQLDCVNYVRKVFCYTADYPTGDPRDKDGPEPG